MRTSLLLIIVFCCSTASAQEKLYHWESVTGTPFFGWTLNGAGDVNADGIPDVIVGQGFSPHQTPTIQVHSGSDGSILMLLTGPPAMPYFGRCVDGAGDVNADGFDDVILGSGYDDDRAWIYSGRDSSLLYEFHEPSGGQFGGAVAGAGDVNADGFEDFLIANTYFKSFGEGFRVYSGRDASILYSGTHAYVRAVDGVGDMNQDGFADWIVGISRAESGSPPDEGRADVYSGIDGSLLHTVVADNLTDLFGSAVAGAGDVDGDGTPDFIVGARWDDDHGHDCGSARVFSGADASVLYHFDGDSAEDRFGWSVAGAGDVDGDSFADLIVGAPWDSNYHDRSGIARIFSGVDGSILCSLDGRVFQSNCGSSVAGVGDLDGDGVADVAVGSENEEIVEVFSFKSPYQTVLRTPSGGDRLVIRARGLLPGEKTWLLLSAKGWDSSWAPQLNVTIGIFLPRVAKGPLHATAAGEAVWTPGIPDPAYGKNVWIQVVQVGMATNVTAATLAP